MNTIVKRALTAAVAGPGVIALLFFGKRFKMPWVVGAFLAISAGIAMIEFCDLMRKSNYQIRLIPNSLITTFGFFALAWFRGEYIGIIGGGMIIAGILANIRNASAKANLKIALASILGILYIPWLIHYLYMIYLAESGVIHAVNVLLIVWGYDSGAYLIGRWIGRHPIAPHISPNKTAEGVLGGLALGFVGASLSPIWVPYRTWIPHIVLLTILVGLATQLGDLTESIFKRSAGVKDSGDLFPGHGGMLDRIDGLLFALPVFYFYFHFILRFI